VGEIDVAIFGNQTWCAGQTMQKVDELME